MISWDADGREYVLDRPTGRVDAQGAIQTGEVTETFIDWAGNSHVLTVKYVYTDGGVLKILDERITLSQLGIDFTPAARELGRVVQNRESKAQRILARLRIAPATSIELAKITHRFGARIHDLRREHKISREDHVHDGQGWSVYTLEGE